MGGEKTVAVDDGYKWRVLFSVIFGIFMVILDSTVVNVAFATFQKEFAASVSASQWVLSLYVMALGIATPLSGYLGDRFGQKRIFVSALGLFTFGSLLCGLAPSLWTLIAARTIQGIGGGLGLPLGTAMLYAAFPASERGKAMGIFGVTLVVAPALGPIVGGWLVDAGLWRWVFFVNVPIGILGVTLGSLWLRTQPGNPHTKFDPLGLLFSTVGFGSALYAASVASEKGWTSPEVLICFAVGAVALAIFAVVELYVAKEPLLDLRLFANWTFTSSSLTGYVSVLALFGAEFLMPLYLQLLRGKTALEAGVLLLPMAISSAIATPIAGRLFDKVGARILAVTGFGLLALNTWQLQLLTADTSVRWIQVLLALRGLALGLTVQTTMLTSLSVVPLQKTARASALINSTRQVVQSIGVAILATVLAASVSSQLSAQLNAYQSKMPAQATAGPHLALCGEEGIAGGVLPMIPAQATQLISQFCDQYVDGLENAYHVTFLASLVAVALGAMLPGWPFAWHRREPAEDAPVIGH